MKIVKESLMNIPTWEELAYSAPTEIQILLKNAESTPQNPVWHPEAPAAKVPHNVLAHMRIVYDRAVTSGDLNLAIAAFFHDIGKVDTTAPNRHGSYSAIGHEIVSAKLVKKYSDWISELGANPEEVYQIVDQHMRIKQYDQMKPSKRRQFDLNPYIEKFNKFTEFDNMKTLTDEELNRYK